MLIARYRSLIFVSRRESEVTSSLYSVRNKFVAFARRRDKKFYSTAENLALSYALNALCVAFPTCMYNIFRSSVTFDL